jgi:hypothetical protein
MRNSYKILDEMSAEENHCGDVGDSGSMIARWF